MGNNNNKNKNKNKNKNSSKEKNEDKKPKMVSPADVARLNRKEQEIRREENSYRFPEGTGHKGKVITAEDTLSEKTKTPCYEIKIQTKEKNKKGKRQNVILRFMKNDKSKGYFYAFLEDAGADLSKIRHDSQEHLDEDIQNLLEKMEEANPKIEFDCVWQENKTHNNYYVKDIDQVLADGDDSDDSDNSEGNDSDDGDGEDDSDNSSNGDDDGDDDGDDSNESGSDDPDDDGDKNNDGDDDGVLDYADFDEDD